MGINFIKQFEDYLSSELGVSIARYIDEVNDFPAASVLEERRERRHYGGETHTIQTLQLRGYIRSSVETALEDTEILARQLEQYTQQFSSVNVELSLVASGIISPNSPYSFTIEELIRLASMNKVPYIEDIRVLSLTTDEGLLAPYGMCDLMIGWTVVTYSR